MMNTIKSFQIDHEKLEPGIYESRVDKIGKGFCSAYVTTYDLRFTRPNREPPIDQSALHTIEHLGAVYLRNRTGYKDNIVYFGPMGCRTGFYLILGGKFEEMEVVRLVESMCGYILNSTKIPGAGPAECGNYLEHNLDLAKYYIEKYLDQIRLKYLNKRPCTPEFH